MFTVKDLKELIKDLPDDTYVVLSERFGNIVPIQKSQQAFYIPILGECCDIYNNEDLKDAKLRLEKRIERQLKGTNQSNIEERQQLVELISQLLKTKTIKRKYNAIELRCAY